MTKDEKARFDIFERNLKVISKELRDHLTEVPKILADQESERRDIWDEVKSIAQRLFGNGTKTGSVEDRLTNTEKDTRFIKENMWTKKEQEMFEKEMRKLIKAPWTTLLQVITLIGVIGAVIVAIVK